MVSDILDHLVHFTVSLCIFDLCAHYIFCALLYGENKVSINQSVYLIVPLSVLNPH